MDNTSNNTDVEREALRDYSSYTYSSDAYNDAIRWYWAIRLLQYNHLCITPVESGNHLSRVARQATLDATKWVTQDGDVCDIRNMDDSHLKRILDAINMERPLYGQRYKEPQLVAEYYRRKKQKDGAAASHQGASQ